jgi:hypothetical protein
MLFPLLEEDRGIHWSACNPVLQINYHLRDTNGILPPINLVSISAQKKDRKNGTIENGKQDIDTQRDY